MLAGVILREQGIEVEWVNFVTPFFSSKNAEKASEITGIPLTVKNITKDYLMMLKNPPAGYGKNMNPCMDCHSFMFKKAGELMMEKGFNFLFSGEVNGQRPMSQTKQSLRYVEKNSGYDGYILRPLSAKTLPETIPEKQGLVDRDRLLDISGRSRKQQMKLAKEYGLKDYPSPAGGCLLTDKGFSTRLRDFFEHQDTYTEKELNLLKFGRHFRLKNNEKVIVGRKKDDNINILNCHNPEKDTTLKVAEFPGPIVLVPNSINEETIMLAASICVGYSKAPDFTPADVTVTTSREKKTIQILGIPPSSVKKLML